MSAGRPDHLDDATLQEAARLQAPAPPPAAALLRAVEGLRPVRPRSRFGAFAAVTLVGVALPAFTAWRTPRRDLGALPIEWLGLGAAVWGAALLGSLAAALIPRRGDVLPSAERASRAALASIVSVVLFAALDTAAAPGVSATPASLHLTLLGSCIVCGRYVLEVALAFLALGWVALRRVLPVGGTRIGLALGAGGGAAAGLALHFHCAIATPAHVAIGHGGAVALAAVLGGLLVPAALGHHARSSEARR